jgi:hypothetical protein
MRALQTMSREKRIQSISTAIAECMMLLLLPSDRLKLVNSIDRDQDGKRDK